MVLDSAAADPVGTARLHEYVYGGCPPVGVEPRVTKVPVVPVEGAVIDTDRGDDDVDVVAIAVSEGLLDPAVLVAVTL